MFLEYHGHGSSAPLLSQSCHDAPREPRFAEQTGEILPVSPQRIYTRISGRLRIMSQSHRLVATTKHAGTPRAELVPQVASPDDLVKVKFTAVLRSDIPANDRPTVPSIVDSATITPDGVFKAVSTSSIAVPTSFHLRVDRLLDVLVDLRFSSFFLILVGVLLMFAAPSVSCTVSSKRISIDSDASVDGTPSPRW